MSHAEVCSSHGVPGQIRRARCIGVLKGLIAANDLSNMVFGVADARQARNFLERVCKNLSRNILRLEKKLYQEMVLDAKGHHALALTCGPRGESCAYVDIERSNGPTACGCQKVGPQQSHKMVARYAVLRVGRHWT
jgi:hypothetical protein